MRRPLRKPHGLRLEDIDNYEETCDYLIHQEGTNIIALDGDTGLEVSRNVDAYTVIAYCLTQLATGGHVHIKQGTYTIDTALNPASYTWISGDGINKTIIFAEAGTTINMIYTSAKEHVRISDLTVDGNIANQAEDGSTILQCCILLNNSDNCRIDNCELKNATQHGIHIYLTSTYNTVSQCYIHDNGHRGLNMYNASISTTILNCKFEDNVDYGIGGHEWNRGCRIIGSDFTGTGKGIYIIDECDYLITGNSFHTLVTNGIEMGSNGHPCTDISIVCNHFYNCNVYDGIKLLYANRIDITSNVFHSSALADDEGIEIGANSTHIVVTANTFVNMVRGVDLAGDDCILNWNVFSNCTTEIADAGTGNIINGQVYETAAAETPAGTYPNGTIVHFVDSGDASGDGMYIIDTLAAVRKLT